MKWFKSRVSVDLIIFHQLIWRNVWELRKDNGLNFLKERVNSKQSIKKIKTATLTYFIPWKLFLLRWSYGLQWLDSAWALEQCSAKPGEFMWYFSMLKLQKGWVHTEQILQIFFSLSKVLTTCDISHFQFFLFIRYFLYLLRFFFQFF